MIKFDVRSKCQKLEVEEEEGKQKGAVQDR